MSGQSKIRRLRWSEQEDAALCAIWQTSKRIKQYMTLFGGHTYGAVMTRAKTLGLGKRKKCPRGTTRWSVDAVLAGLGKGTAHQHALVKCTRLHETTVCAALVELHEANKIHIVGWHRTCAVSGPPIAIYEIGKGIDEPRPVPLSEHAKKKQKKRQMDILAHEKGESVEGLDPLATFLPQLAWRPVHGFDIPYGTLEKSA